MLRGRKGGVSRNPYYDQKFYATSSKFWVEASPAEPPFTKLFTGIRFFTCLLNLQSPIIGRMK